MDGSTPSRVPRLLRSRFAVAGGIISTMHVEMGLTRRSVTDILAGQKWDAREYRQITGDDITDLAGSVSGVPKAVYQMADKADRALDEAFINRLRLCTGSTERAFPNRYEQVVLARHRNISCVCTRHEGQ